MSFISDRIKGILFLSFTIFSWIGSAVFIKIIFTTMDFSKAFLMIYIADGLTCLYAFSFLRNCFNRRSRTDSDSDSDSDPASKTDTSNVNYIKLAIIFAPCLFVPNYLYAEGLKYTTVASVEIISNSSFIFIFVLSIPILGTKFSWVKLLSICGAFGGVVLIQLIDYKSESTNPNEHYLRGDIICSIATIMYAFYGIYLKKYVPDDSKFNWFGFFGILGISVLVMFFPMFFILDACGIEEFEFPEPKLLFYLLINGICGTVLSNYTWARSVVLLSPLIAELGIGITIPLGLIANYFLEKKGYNPYYLLGSAYIMAGFVIATLHDYYDEKVEEERRQALRKTFLTESNRTSIIISD